MFKRVTLEQLAIKNIKTTNEYAKVKVGDIVNVINPWRFGNNYSGIIVEKTDKTMTVYHGNLNKKLTWPLNVKCEIIKL